MVSVYEVKPKFQRLLRPLVGKLASFGITANAVTGIAIFGSLAVGFAVSMAGARPALLLLLPAWLFVRMALNAIDGMMAREHKMASFLGAILNEVGDVVSDLALTLPLARVHPPSLWPVISFALAAVVTEFCGVLGQALGAARQYQGPMGKSDRALLIGALALVTTLFPRVLAAWPWVFGCGALLAAWTCVQRSRAALGELEAKSRE